MTSRDDEHPGHPGEPQAPRTSGQSLSMHDGIGVWCDCCSCEAEERWVEVGEQMGLDMGDYEPLPGTQPGNTRRHESAAQRAVAPRSEGEQE